MGKVKVLIATGQLIGEGFDCKDLSTLFFVTPIRFSGRVVQYLGRILRPAPNKEKARFFDYVDINDDTLKAAAMARQKVYNVDRYRTKFTAFLLSAILHASLLFLRLRL